MFYKTKKLLRISSQKRKKKYFAKLNEKNTTNNRKFWETVKPSLN